MAAAESAGGIGARIDAHLDAGCDAVLVCAPTIVPDSLAAMERRPPPRVDALASLFGRGRSDWNALLADPRHASARARVVGDGVAEA